MITKSYRRAVVLSLAALLALAGPMFAPTPAKALGVAGRTVLALDGRCPEAASICSYRLPDNVQGARDACYRTEASARGVPGDDAAYRAWWSSATAQQRADWTRAHQRCQDRHQLPGGKWAWDQMIYVGLR